jgi:hypothetical protein
VSGNPVAPVQHTSIIPVNHTSSTQTNGQIDITSQSPTSVVNPYQNIETVHGPLENMVNTLFNPNNPWSLVFGGGILLLVVVGIIFVAK